MTRQHLHPASLLLAALALTLAGWPAQAQVPTDAAAEAARQIGQQQRLERLQLERLRQEQRLQQPPPNPDVLEMFDIDARSANTPYEAIPSQEPSPLPPEVAARERNIVVRRIVVTPNSAILSEAEIRGALTPFEGRTLSLAELYQATAALNSLYDSKGMPTARAVLPSQDVRDGVVQLRLIEARVGSVKVSAPSLDPEFVRHRLRMKEETLLAVSELESDLQRYNQLNQSRLSASVKAGRTPGTTDVELLAQEPQPQRFSATVDNAGRSTVGENRLGLSAQWYGLAGYDDTLLISAMGSKGSSSVAVGYGLALPRNDWRLDLNLNADRIKVIDGPYKVLDIGGSAHGLAAQMSRPLSVDTQHVLRNYWRLSYKNSTSTFGGFTQTSTDLLSLTSGISQDHFSPTLSRTLDANLSLGSKTGGDKGNYVVWRANAAWLYLLDPKTQWLLRANTQYSPTSLLPSAEQFQAGGSVSVRGYSEGLLTGRSGYLLSAELRRTLYIAESSASQISGLAFIDHGAAFPYRPEPQKDITRQDFLTSVGTGLLVNWTRYAQARLTLGWPLRNQDLEADLQRPRLHALLTLTWP